MNWHATGISILLTVAIAGCAQSPSGADSANSDAQATNIENDTPEGPGVIEEHVSEADMKRMAGCRKMATTGNRVKTWVCGAEKDDRKMLSIVNSANN